MKKTIDLSIDSFEWETNRTKYNDTDCYSLSLTNNSDYDIITVEFTYKVKDNVNDSDLAVYEEFMKAHAGFIKENDSPKDVVLIGNKNSLVAKGKQLTGIRFNIGFNGCSWHDDPTDEQFKLMEPKRMQIGVIGKDNVFYTACYDFEDDSWVLYEITELVDTWSEKEIAKRISKPNEVHHIVEADYEDEFVVHSYGVKKDEYIKYAERLKNAGFKEESYSSSCFIGKDADGYVVVLSYYSDDEKLYISIENKS